MPAPHVFICDRKRDANAFQSRVVSRQNVADGTDLGPHRKSLVAEPVGNREIPQSARPRRRGKCRQQNHIDIRRQSLHNQESAGRLHPLVQGNEQHVDHDQETENERNHRPRETLKNLLDVLARHQQRNGEQDYGNTDRIDGRCIRIPCQPHEKRGEQDCGTGLCQSGGRQLSDADQNVKPSPDLRPRMQPHDPGDDWLARVHRVPSRLQIEDRLQHDPHGCDPQDPATVLDCGERPDNPLATPDGRRQQNRTWSDGLEQIDHTKRQWFRQIILLPSGKPAMIDGRVRCGSNGRSVAHRMLSRRSLQGSSERGGVSPPVPRTWGYGM